VKEILTRYWFLDPLEHFLFAGDLLGDLLLEGVEIFFETQ
jgi:hypothetical protein